MVISERLTLGEINKLDYACRRYERILSDNQWQEIVLMNHKINSRFRMIEAFNT